MTAAQITINVELIDRAKIDPSPTNPRKRFDSGSLNELAQDIARNGILQPVMVRPKKRGRYELIFGERRFRAAEIAGLSQIPCTVRAMTDLEAVQIQLTENSQREDVHPLDEARTISWLLEKHVSAEELADKIGKSPSYIYKRSKLSHLCRKAQDLFYDNVLTVKHAELLSRLNEGQQEKVLEAKISVDSDGTRHVHSVRDYTSYIKSTFSLCLVNATFSIACKELHPEAGDCVSCPKNTACATTLFPDLDNKARCMDAECYKLKKQLHFENRKQKIAGEFNIDPAKVVEITGNWYSDAGLLREQSLNEIIEPCESMEVGVFVENDYNPEKIGTTLKFCRNENCKVHHDIDDEIIDEYDDSEARRGLESIKLVKERIKEKILSRGNEFGFDDIVFLFFKVFWLCSGHAQTKENLNAIAAHYGVELPPEALSGEATRDKVFLCIKEYLAPVIPPPDFNSLIRKLMIEHSMGNDFFYSLVADHYKVNYPAIKKQVEEEMEKEAQP